MRMPNFVVLGAPRAGTTSLYHYLKQHPQIYMTPCKEPQFFALGEMDLNMFRGPLATEMPQLVISSLDRYQALFANVTDEIAVGEASMTNLLPRAEQRIRHYLPGAKLIVILRQPAERAYSQFLHARGMGWEPLASFEKALQQEEERLHDCWTPFVRYKERGFYGKLLQPYFADFPKEQIRVYLYEDWQQKPAAILSDIFRFIGVDDSFCADLSKRYNVSQISKSKISQNKGTSQRFLQPVFRLLPGSLRKKLKSRFASRRQSAPPPLSPTLKKSLNQEYRQDIALLSVLIDRDCTHWLID